MNSGERWRHSGGKKTGSNFLTEAKSCWAPRSSAASVCWNVLRPSAKAVRRSSQEEMRRDWRGAGAEDASKKHKTERKKERKKRHTQISTGVGGGVERMSVLCCITCVCITECALYTAPLIQKVFPYKSPLHTIYSKILQKTSEVGGFFFLSFMVFFFPLPE